jgi:membrane protein DedA with SNARE-associated domain
MAVKPFWLFIAVVCVLVAWRFKGAGRPIRVAVAIAAIVATLVGLDIIHIPSIEELIETVGDSLGKWTYLLVGVNAFLETGAFLGFVAPGETMVLFGGVLAGEGTIEVVPLILVVWFSAMLGDITSYTIGRRSGRDFLLRHGRRFKIGEPQIQFVEDFFTRHGDLTILFGRWVGVVRPLVPFLAGSSGVSFWRFLIVDLISTLAWSAALVLIGSIFWQNFEQLTSVVGRGLLIVGTLIGVAFVLYLAVAARRSPERGAAVEQWLAKQRKRRFAIGRPAGALWALVTRIEPSLPGGKARRPAPATAGTVPQDADPGGPPPPAEPPSDER